MKTQKPIWTTTVDPSEYDYVAQFTLIVEWANKNEEPYPPTDVGKVWGLVQAYQRLERENAALRVQLEDMTNQFFAVSQENAALRTDKERLRWLYKNEASVIFEPRRSRRWCFPHGVYTTQTPDSWRFEADFFAAIDAARAEEGGAT